MVKPAVNLNFYASNIFTSHASHGDQKRCDDVCSNFLTPENFHELLNGMEDLQLISKSSSGLMK